MGLSKQRRTRTALVIAVVATAVSTFGSNALADTSGTAPGVAPLLDGGGGEEIDGQYVVVYRGEPAAASPRAAEAFDQALERIRGLGAQPRQAYRHALNGVAVRLTDQQLDAVRRDPSVEYVARDGIAHADATQLAPPSWGLDRSDQRTLPLDTSYGYSNDGTGVTAYVIDSGIRATHSDFTGRVLPGYAGFSDGYGTDDCAGHGTHVAGTLGGTTYGVAKKVKLVSVRVLDCTNRGPWSVIIAGVDWVTANRTGPSVANMSIGGGAYQPVDDAVARSIQSNVVYAVSASNDNADACMGSPGRTPTAITVGATDATDKRASFSNWGACLDIFAPGVDIPSSYVGTDTASQVWSGTSMAAPHVAGVAALHLQSSPTATPATVASSITGNATTGRVLDPGTGSPNRLLYTAPSTTLSTAEPTTQPAIVSTLKAQHRNYDSAVSDGQLKPGVAAVNTGTSKLALSSVKIRYWFTRDGGATTFSTHCDYALLGCANVSRKVVLMPTAKTGADAYLEVGFTSTTATLAAGATTGDLQLRVTKSDWSAFNESNDFSWRTASSTYTDNSKVSVYVDGKLVSGQEP